MGKRTSQSTDVFREPAPGDLVAITSLSNASLYRREMITEVTKSTVKVLWTDNRSRSFRRRDGKMVGRERAFYSHIRAVPWASDSTHEDRSRRLRASLADGTLRPHTTRASEVVIPSLLATVAPEVATPRARRPAVLLCPSDVMPRWVANVTDLLDRHLAPDAWHPFARRYATLFEHWHTLDATDWWELEHTFMAALLRLTVDLIDDNEFDDALAAVVTTAVWLSKSAPGGVQERIKKLTMKAVRRAELIGSMKCITLPPSTRTATQIATYACCAAHAASFLSATRDALIHARSVDWVAQAIFHSLCATPSLGPDAATDEAWRMISETWLEIFEHYLNESGRIEPGHACEVANRGCEHPARWRSYSGASENRFAAAPHVCSACSRRVCSACSTSFFDRLLCWYCATAEEAPY